MAIRHAGRAPKFCVNAFRVVATLPSTPLSLLPVSAQYQLVLSPRSMPIVTGSRSSAALPRVGLFSLLLCFFMPVSSLHLECVSDWDSLSLSPHGDRPSHPISGRGECIKQWAAGAPVIGAAPVPSGRPKRPRPEGLSGSGALRIFLYFCGTG